MPVVFMNKYMQRFDTSALHSKNFATNRPMTQDNIYCFVVIENKAALRNMLLSRAPDSGVYVIQVCRCFEK